MTSWHSPRWPGSSAAGVIGATGTLTQLSQSVFRAKGCFSMPVRSRWGDKAFFVPVLQTGKAKSLPGQVVRPGKEESFSPAQGSGVAGWALGWRWGRSLCTQRVPSSGEQCLCVCVCGGALGSALSTKEPETRSWPGL